jgi:threonine dehydrogenase-like Zn-dependent dehydrogenase
MRYPKESINHHVPQDLPLEKAILVEPFACSAWCIKRANIQLDDFVVLAGAGTLGLGMVGCARLRNPKKLVVLDVLGVHLGPYCYPFVIDAIGDGRLPTEGVVTHKLPLEEYGKGLEMMKKGEKSLKILLVP